MNNKGQLNVSRETGLACAVTFLQPDSMRYRLAANAGPDFGDSHGFRCWKETAPKLSLPHSRYSGRQGAGFAEQAEVLADTTEKLNNILI